jgi:tRNA pseudouridine38-40 synthase
VPTARLLAVVEYDGSDFAGFQLQSRPSALPERQPRTIQAELERALRGATGRAARVVGAGRTDAGVHASGQVVHFDLDAGAPLAHDLPQLARAMNAHLPADVAVRAIQVAPTGFHARYSALSRRYCYRIVTATTRSPLHRRFAAHVRDRLAVERMRAAACDLVGTHDFVAFGARQGPGSTKRRVIRATVGEVWATSTPVWHTDAAGAAGAAANRATSDGEARLVEIRVEANAFLRHMMRRIAGTLIRIGAGQLTPDALAQALATGDKALAGPAAPAQGLCLEHVAYGSLLESSAGTPAQEVR